MKRLGLLFLSSLALARSIAVGGSETPVILPEAVIQTALPSIPPVISLLVFLTFLGYAYLILSRKRKVLEH